ncbi:hypothetical protein EON65_05205 [archaeon]|nr:MAG: hypothetical protein EON65_05205 [archaeon]
MFSSYYYTQAVFILIVFVITQEKQILESLANLKKERGRIQGRINLAANRDKVKFPVKDELIEQLDPTGKPPLPIPLAHTDLSEDIPERYVHDAVGVWDFLNMFRLVGGF